MKLAFTWWTGAHGHILWTLFDGRLSLLARQFQMGHVSPQSLNALHLKRQFPHDALHILKLLAGLIVILHFATVNVSGQGQRGSGTELLFRCAEEAIYCRRDPAAVVALLHQRLLEDVIEAGLELR